MVGGGGAGGLRTCSVFQLWQQLPVTVGGGGLLELLVKVRRIIQSLSTTYTAGGGGGGGQGGPAGNGGSWWIGGGGSCGISSNRWIRKHSHKSSQGNPGGGDAAIQV